jgi:hypothetical protein
MFKINRLFLLLGVTLACLTGCDNNEDDPKIDNEEEVITTVTLSLTSNTAQQATATWKDADGSGGNAPVIQTLTLKANTTYDGTVKLQNERANPVTNISDEVLDEGVDHEFFYEISGANLTVVKTDKDAKNLPIGLTGTFTTGAAGSGTLTVILKHKPGQKAAGDTKAKGGTDVEVTFPVTISD